MKTQDLILAGALGSFLFHDHNANLSCIKPSSAIVKINTSYNPENLFNVTPALTDIELATFNRLEEIWGDDEDGAYETLFSHHEDFNAKVI